MKIHNLSTENSIVNQFVAELRDVNIHNDSMRFRKNLERIGEILAYEISKTLTYSTKNVQTPLGIAEAPLYSDQIVLSTILRAGLPLHQGFLNIFDGAENAFVSAFRKYKRDHSSFQIVVEYMSSPSLDDKILILTDPMLATGSSMELAYCGLLQRGTPKHIHLASAIASQQGIDYASQIFPKEKTTVWTAVVDPDLNEHSYIVPGIGDAGDLAYGQKI
ncbi:MAG: uracil phosphoribosyltransferase [Dysgonamonadaceae bacterium]|jgi:uracil phosphoribosyltransferase|nr:uracil phosphoribosyltransferase [Dysgonamonadaceae bacterium]